MKPHGPVLVTGATGFVGRALVARLRGAGMRVRVAIRVDDSSVAEDRIVIGNIARNTDWRMAVAGCRAIVHLANLAHGAPGGSDDAELRSVNVEASARLARQGVEAGVRRFVYLSSVKVLGEETPGAAFDELCVPNPQDAYARAKADAETALREIAAGTPLALVIVRSPLVYGAGVKANFLALLRVVDRGWPLPLGGIRNRRSVVYVGNLVDAIARCIEHPAAAGRTLLVSDGAPISTPALASAMARALGKPARLVSIPARLLELGGAILGRGDAVKRLTRSLEVDDSAIRRELGWQPPFSFEQGMRLTAEWFKAVRRGSGG